MAIIIGWCPNLWDCQPISEILDPRLSKKLGDIQTEIVYLFVGGDHRLGKQSALFSILVHRFIHDPQSGVNAK